MDHPSLMAEVDIALMKTMMCCAMESVRKCLGVGDACFF